MGYSVRESFDEFVTRNEGIAFEHHITAPRTAETCKVWQRRGVVLFRHL
jgi:hypothetical protein